MALFPTNPANGQTTVVNGITYTYNSAQTAWIRTSTIPPGNLDITGNITATGNISGVRLISTVATGTAPLTVTSTTRVSNLNVAYANVADNINVAAGSGNNFIVFANAATGNIAELTSTGLTANLSNNSITATTFVGALSGAATSATTAGTVTTAAQPNITSVGTLTGLTIGNATANAVFGNGTITLNSGLITGNGAGLSQLAGSNVTGTVANATFATSAGSATTAGTVTTAAQPNITSVGTLTDLNVTGNALIGGNLTINGNLTYLNVDTLSIEDPIIQLQSGPNGAAPIANTGKDVGTALNYYDTAARVAFMGWDVSNVEFGLASQASITNEVVTFTTYGNLRVGNIIGNGQALTALNGSNVTGTVANATFATTAGTVTTAAQPNITSVGTLTSLAITGNATAGNVYANSGTIGASLLTGTLTTAAQPNITSVGTLTSLAVTGNASAGNLNTAGAVVASTLTSNIATGTAPLTVTSTTRVSNLNVAYANVADNINVAAGTGNNFIVFANAATGNVVELTSTGLTANLSNNSITATTFVGALSGAATSATTAGTVTTNAQPNITSVGTLSTLTVSGNTFLATSSGNVGIGTASPGFRLDVTGTGRFTGLTQFDNDVTLNKATLNYLYFVDAVAFARTGVGERMRIDSAGNVGIGTTTPNFPLDVQRNSATSEILRVRNDTVGAAAFITARGGGGGTVDFGCGADASTFVVRTASTERMRIASDGNVGIGTTSPGSILGVNGTVTAAAFTANTGVFTGNGNGLSSIVGANVTGTVASATAATNASALLQNTSTATTVYPKFSTSSANGNSSSVINTGISANLGNASITATTFVGALSGAATSAITAGTVTTAAQPNITSVGTLTSLTVTGNTTSGSFVGALANGNSNVNIPTANGNINLTANGNLTLVVTGTGANITGTLNTGTGNANVGNLGAAQILASANIGVGTTSPDTAIMVVDQNNLGWSYYQYNNNDGTNFRNYRAYGTIDSPAAVVANARLGSFLAGGYNGNAFNFMNGGMGIYASENYSNLTTTGGTYLTFGTSANGTNPAGGGLERMRIDPNGNVGIANNAPVHTLSVTGTASVSGNATVGNLIATTLAGNLTTAAQPNITSVGTLTDLNVTGNALIGGNLTINGNLTYLNVDTLSIEDPIINLQTGANGAAPTSNSGKDVGTALNYYDTAARVAFMGWDVSNVEFGLASQASITNEVVTFTTYGNLRVGNIIGNGQALTGITGASITGQVANALVAGTVYTAAQPNITSVGTLTGLTVSGTTGPTLIGGYTQISGYSSAVGIKFLGGGSQFGIAIQPATDTTQTMSFFNAANTIIGSITQTASNVTWNGLVLGGNVTGTVANAVFATSADSATTAGTVTTAAQPNITSVGTLSGLTVTATITGSVSGSAGTVTNGVYTTDNVVTARSTAISTNTSDFNTFTTAGTYQVSGNGTWTGSTNGPTNAYSYGQLIVTTNGSIVTQVYYTHAVTGNFVRSKFNDADWTAWQEVLTSTNYNEFAPTLTGGGASGNWGINVTGSAGTATTAGTVTTAAQPNITSVGTLTSLTTTTITTGANTTAGTITGHWSLTAGSCLTATYADIAEKYVADATYDPGTVLMFGGEFEVTLANTFNSTKVAGVVTTNPAYSMNSALEAEHVAEIALQGRVPCKVIGPIEKGDLMVSASNGYAAANNDARAGTIIGKALENFVGESGIIEVAVGRF